MAFSDSWLKEFEEAMTLVDDISGRLRERDSIVSSGGDPSQLVSSTRRKITVLGTCVDRLESLLQNPPEKPRIDEDELYRRQDMLLGMRYKTNQMAASFSTSPSNRMYSAPQEQSARNVQSASGTPCTINLGLRNEGRRENVTDVTENAALSIPLLSHESGASSFQSKNHEGDGIHKCCTWQIACLICLGISALVLLVWTIIWLW